MERTIAIKTRGRVLEEAQHASHEYRSDWDSLLSALRRSPIKAKLSATFHIVRQLIHFGPWRFVPKYAIPKLRPALAREGGGYSLLGPVDADAIAAEIRKNSVAMVGALPAEFVARQRRITDRLPYGEYKLVHEVDDDLRHLVEDPGVANVLRAYLGCEPVLLEASLFVSMPEHDIPDQGQNAFHFDYAGWESLNVFVYLTDVKEASSCHIVARGSHRDVRITDVWRGSLTPAEGARRFGDSILPVTGAAGTVFFENTEAFHRRNKGNERRVLLCLLYASHRSLLSHGRADGADIGMRDSIYATLREPVISA